MTRTRPDATSRLSKIAVFAVVALVLLGAVRVGLNGRVLAFGAFSAGEDFSLAGMLRNCEEFFGDGKGDRRGDRVQSENAEPPVPSIVPLGQTRCQTYVRKALQIDEDLLEWRLGLVVVAALLGLATLFVAFMVIRRSARAGTAMLQLFVVQLLAAGLKIDLALRQAARFDEVALTLWPEAHSQGVYWLIANIDWCGRNGRVSPRSGKTAFPAGSILGEHDHLVAGRRRP